MRLVIFRRQRSKWGWEYHNYNGVVYINLWWGSPRHHRWWAASVYWYLKGARCKF